jgi:RNA polymerase-binding transcription factor DksA
MPAGGDEDMNAIESALREELQDTIGRLNGLGGAVVFEDYPGALEADDQGEGSGDGASIGEEREMAFTVRGRLVERANRLAEALGRLRSGEYGICQVCGGPIAPARLRALPEVTTCVACQEAAERRGGLAPRQAAAR